MARPTFILQGVRGNNDHESVLKKLLSTIDFSEIILSVAFVRESGVLPLAELLKKYSSKVSIYAGIRNGNTSAQGLRALLNCKVNLFVVDTGSTSPIFHPKVYLGLGNTIACAVIGSANLTYSGLNQNIEDSTILNLDRTEQSDEAFLQDLISAMSTLKNNYPDHVINISQKRHIISLLDQGRIEDERYTTVPRSGQLRKNTQRDQLKRIRLNVKRKPIPVPQQPKKPAIKRIKKIIGQLELVWISKGLTERDLNIPSGKNTNPTGSMLFKKGQIEGIDQRTFFREVVFSNLRWTKDSPSGYTHLERAQAEFEIIIKGISYGTFRLKLTHNTKKNTRAYEQKNAMTQIHWSEAKDIIAQRDLLDRELRLYQKIDHGDSFVINID